MSIQCRTCAAMSFNPNAKNIFDNEEILLNIEVLTGILIKEEENMPSYICTCCYLDLYYSIAFRERCRKTEDVLQCEKEKMKLDPLLRTKKTIPISKNKVKPDASKEKEDVLDTLNSDSSSQASNQRRSYRIQTQNSKASNKILLKNREKCETVSKACIDPTTTENIQNIPQNKNENWEEWSNTASDESIGRLSAQSFNFSASNFDGSLSSPSKIITADDVDQSLPSPSEITDEDTSPKTIEEPCIEKSDKLPTLVSSKKRKNNEKPKVEPKLLMCELCGYQTAERKNLNIHILRHKGEKNFECPDCGLKYYSESLMKTHQRVIHKGEEPFSCKYCDKRFRTSSARLMHEKVQHIREYRYECKLCGKKYIIKTDLRKHLFLHTGLKPYRCDLCNVGFPRRPGLKVHCRTQQHKKREMEAQNSQSKVLNEINEITTPDESIVFSDSIIDEIVELKI